MTGEPSKSEASISVTSIKAAETIPLRHSILRPGRPISTAHFQGDSDPDTRHFGAFREKKLVGIASLFREKLPEMREFDAYQLRGMAVEPAAQSTGVGRALTLACIALATEKRAEILWCNARACAVGFYRKLGFETLGNEIHMPDVGPHLRMFFRLGARTA